VDGHNQQAKNIKMMQPNGVLARNEEESAKVLKDHFEANERFFVDLVTAYDTVNR
jgi:hypothetical protein